MKVSEQFKSTIKAYLDNMAAVDSLFAVVLVMMKFLVWRCTIIRKIILRWVAH